MSQLLVMCRMVGLYGYMRRIPGRAVSFRCVFFESTRSHWGVLGSRRGGRGHAGSFVARLVAHLIQSARLLGIWLAVPCWTGWR